MARIQGSFPYVTELNGVFERKHKGDTAIVARTIYGNTVACKVTYSDKPATAAQTMAQERFASAQTKASADMKDPEKKAEWKAIADASHGKFKTARGAAFAHYYANGDELD
jgi:hypothetical protein